MKLHAILLKYLFSIITEYNQLYMQINVKMLQPNSWFKVFKIPSSVQVEKYLKHIHEDIKMRENKQINLQPICRIKE